MHLVYLALDKRAIPQALPAELQRSAAKHVAPSDGFVAHFPKDIGPPPAVPPLPAILKNNIPPAIPPMPQVSSRQNSVPLISMVRSFLLNSCVAFTTVIDTNNPYISEHIYRMR